MAASSKLASFALRTTLLLGMLLSPVLLSAGEPGFDALAAEYSKEIRPLIRENCWKCHSTKKQQGDIDLEAFVSLADVRKSSRTWEKVLEMLDSAQMPPKEVKQPSDADRLRLRTWVRSYLKLEARALAGDPGPVVLRRLSNAEYTYTIRDLTGVDLQPARQFPADGAAGEGFTNTGQALVVSPALLGKYLDAGKDIAAHAMLLPDGIRFSPSTTRRDWTNEIVGQIRDLYREYSDSQGGTRVNLQGIVFDTNDGGRLPVEKYFDALLKEREALLRGSKTCAEVAQSYRLSPKYLAGLWSILNSSEPSLLLDSLRGRWRTAKPGDAGALAVEVNQWQNALMRFQSVGHMKPWMVPANPLTNRQEIRLKVPQPASGNEAVIYLTAGDAGGGHASDFVVWQQPRLVLPGRPDLLLRDVRSFTEELAGRRARLFQSTAKALTAIAEASGKAERLDVAKLASQHGIAAEDLAAWVAYLGIGTGQGLKLEHFTRKLPGPGAYEFVKGWGLPETPSVVANSSDRHVRIPGNMKAHGVCVHPSPTLNVAVGWQSPIDGSVRVEAKVTHAHPECGNGVTWSLEVRRGATRQRLAAGIAQGSREIKIGPIEKLTIRKDDLVSLLIGPRDGNHSCDLTDLELVVREPAEKGRGWSLTRDVSADILAGNPHADGFGNKNVWHFYSEPVQGGDSGATIAIDSVLGRWLAAQAAGEKASLADDVQKLLLAGPPKDAKHPDAALYRQLVSLSGPLFARSPATRNQSAPSAPRSTAGLEPALFGKHPNGTVIDPASLCVRAPSIMEIRLPADLFAGAEFVAAGVLHGPTGSEGSVQLQALTSKPPTSVGLRPDLPVVVGDSAAARQRWQQAFDDFRRWFPAALCYTKIVPVDEVITLTLFHREDEPLSRLMLDEKRQARLDRLWHELRFVSQDAFASVDAYAQLMEYATQDSNPKLFEHLRKPIHDRAAALRQELLTSEPKHVEAVIEFAARAYRRPLTGDETQRLRELYRNLRAQKLPHDEAARLLLARVLVAPSFLYHLEKAGPGAQAAPVSDWELASRLSYFLWSSVPDEELRAAAAAGRLREPEVLVGQMRRMLKDPKMRRLATEFACQWLHIYAFDTLDEKSERHFPTFVGLRGDMYEEAIRFFTDMFQSDGSVLSVLDADHTFVNEALARHYGIPGVTGPEWRRVDGVKKYGRGGILGLAATLAKQSGASRTSPILRGTWTSEVLLGEKLPKPPKDVPRLPEDETATEGLTVRQLVEKHSSDPRCAVCHVRVDPFGFALEAYDAIGRRRERDLANRPIDTRTKTKDGTELDGLDGLRNYLLTKRRQDVLRVLNRKLLGYSLGRAVQLSDEPLLEELQLQLEKNGFRFSVAVETIVRSKQFREIRGKEMVE